MERPVIIASRNAGRLAIDEARAIESSFAEYSYGVSSTAAYSLLSWRGMCANRKSNTEPASRRRLGIGIIAMFRGVKTIRMAACPADKCGAEK